VTVVRILFNCEKCGRPLVKGGEDRRFVGLCKKCDAPEVSKPVEFIYDPYGQPIISGEAS
jgi:hypothetical protein